MSHPLSHLQPLSGDRLKRHERYHKRAIEVFGNVIKAGDWFSRPCPELGNAVPTELALSSDEGCDQVMAELSRLSKVVEPDDPRRYLRSRRRR